MPWFWVDDAFADSKPVMALDRSLRNEAIGLWVRCGAWSAKEETDGRVGLDTVKSFDGTPRLIRALHEQAGLWTESSPESWRDSREILFKSWEKWQKTRAENQARRKREAEKKATWRSGKKGRDFVPASGDSDMSTGDNMVDNDRDSEFVSTGVSRYPYPDPTRPDPSLVTSSGEVASVDASDSPRPQCNRHATNSETEACIPCMKREKWDKAHPGYFAKLEADEKRRLAEIRENCPRCHGTNTYTDENGETRTCPPHITREARHG